MPAKDLDQVVNLCKRRGFVYPSGEIYGGFRSSYDYGPLGSLMLRNVKEAWVRTMVQQRDDVVLIDAAILGAPQVFEASGHLSNFSDPLVDCTVCKRRFRQDQIEDRDCPQSKKGCEFTDARAFNLMFKTFVGPVEDMSNTVYLRPETAQGIFVNFKNVLDSTRQKPPFGIAQIGKAFRNEINTKNFLFRTREFEQMEMQYFMKPGTEREWFDYWFEQRWNWFINLGMDTSVLRAKPHEKLAHYASAATDIEFLFPFGWGEIEGIHSRTDFDLKNHQEFSGKKQEYVDTVTKERYTPYVIETSVGASRSFMAFLCNAFAEEDIMAENGNSEKRSVLRFHPSLAPVKAAVFPLTSKDGLPEIAEPLYRDLQKIWRVQMDESGSIGKRYRRQDEIGTPFCITIDNDTIIDQAVTIRNRDTMQQERINISRVKEYISTHI